MCEMAKSNSKNKEIEGLLQNELITLKKHDVNNDDPSDSQIDGDISAEKEECKTFMERETFILANSVDDYRIKIWRKKKISINKSLFAFRVTQFLWYGAGSIPSVFIGIFLKQRGLSLVELSSVFAMIFLFQFIACSITGVIADKIGNAKPVLLFLMLSTSSVLVSMLLTPNINNISCTEMQENFTYSNVSDSRKNFSSCYYCLLKNKKHFQSNENYTGISLFENASVAENLRLIKNNSENNCGFSSISLTNDSTNLLNDGCCKECANNKKVHCINDRKRYLVAVYAILVLALYSVWSTTYRFMNFVAASLAAKEDSHFGKELAFAKCGNLFITIIAAFVLNIDKSSGSEINFEPIIWIAAGIMFCAFLTLYINTIPILPPGKNLMRKAVSLVKDIDILAFILLVFVAGNGFAFNYTFHLVFLETLNAPSLLVSLHSVAVILYGFPAYLTSKWWIKKFGENKLFPFCLLFLAVHNVAFSYISNPWWSLIIDSTAAFTDHLYWVAVVLHCRNVAPVGFAATLNALTGSVQFGFGRSSGVFFGGMMMNYLGPRKAYRIMAAIFFITAFLYSIFMYIRHKYPKVNAIANGSGTAETKCSKNTDIIDV